MSNMGTASLEFANPVEGGHRSCGHQSLIIQQVVQQHGDRIGAFLIADSTLRSEIFGEVRGF